MSTARPTVAGWYWCRRIKTDQSIEWETIVQIDRIDGKLYVGNLGFLNYIDSKRFGADFLRSEWCPIARPE